MSRSHPFGTGRAGNTEAFNECARAFAIFIWTIVETKGRGLRVPVDGC